MNVESLQQEQPDADFEKELDRIWFDNKFGNRFGNSAVDFANVREICKHFFELGLNARKEEQDMEWKELKWYKADKDYSFSFVKCLVIAKNGNVVIRDHANKGEYYIPLPLIKGLPKE